MGLFRRLISSDYRAAVAAEASGDYELAAQRFALAGHHEEACRTHLVRAQRAENRGAEIAALRDALHWAPHDSPWHKRATLALASALIARGRAEAIVTEYDREQIRQAARLFAQAGAHTAEADAYELLEDNEAAARAHQRAGNVSAMEQALHRASRLTDRERTLHQAYADYEIELRGGNRDKALSALRTCIQHSQDPTDLTASADRLESQLITNGTVTFLDRASNRIIVTSSATVTLGRDNLCEIALRARGISRRHAQIFWQENPTSDPGGDGWQPMLIDLDSRNGTHVGSLPISGAVSLKNAGYFALGDEISFAYSQPQTDVLLVEVVKGLDAGTRAILTRGVAPVALDVVSVPGTLTFRQGRPIFVAGPTATGLRFNQEPISTGALQLIAGDVLELGTSTELRVQ